jgi:hypothetical protein
MFAAVAAAFFVSAAAAATTPLPPIAAKKTSCPKKLWKVSGHYPVTVMVAVEKGGTRARACSPARARMRSRSPARNTP